VNAQIPGAPKNLLSPNAASLGQYGEIPVTLFTGTPSINIPIHELKYGQVTVPIALSYHASGIRPDQHPGWVGLGWTLQAGGMISRTIKDLPDEYNNGKRYDYDHGTNEMISLDDAGFYFSSYLYGIDLKSTVDITNHADNNLAVSDTEPDEFSFQFLDYSGKFYINENGNWQVECDKPVKVEFKDNDFIDPPYISKYTNSNSSLGSNTPSFKGFTITDENGVQYVFGGDNTSIEYSIDFFYQNQREWYANSWMLTKIIQPNGETINFEYVRDALISQMYISYVKSNLGLNSGNDTGGCANGSPNENDYFEGMLIAPVYLNKITTPFETVEFTHSNTKELRYPKVGNSAIGPDFSPGIYDAKFQKFTSEDDASYYFTDPDGLTHKYSYFLPYIQKWNPKTNTFDDEFWVYNNYDYYLDNLQWQQLDQISIMNTDLKDTQGFDFRKEFDFLYSSDPNQRLTLNAIEESVNADNQNQGKFYRFDYYDVNKLPPYLANEVDHWGYYNGIKASITNTDNYFTLREPHTTDTGYEGFGNSIYNYGSLKSITYPTGGCTVFNYEPHRYSNQLKLNRWQGCEAAVRDNMLAGGLRIQSIINYPYGKDNSKGKIEKRYIYLLNCINGDFTGSSSGVLGGQIKYNFTANIPFIVNKTRSIIAADYIFSTQSVLPACINSCGSHIGYSEVAEVNSDGSYTRNVFTNYHYDETTNKYEYMDDPYESILIDANSPYAPCTSRMMERGKLKTQETYNSAGICKTKKEISYIRVNEHNNVKSLRLAVKDLCNFYAYFYDATAYQIYTYSYLPETETETIYDGTTPLINTTSYVYNDNRLITEKTTTNSEQNSLIMRYKYTGDVAIVSTTDETMKALLFMKTNNMLAYPLETTKSIVKNGQEYVVGSNLNLYKKFDINCDAIVKINPDLSITTITSKQFYKLSSEQSLAIDKPIINFSGVNLNSGTFTYDPRYKEKVKYNNYDLHGNPLYVTKNGVENTVYLWGYDYQYPIAEIKNATIDEVRTYITESQMAVNADLYKSHIVDFLRSKLPNALISTYSYIPALGLIQSTAPNGTSIYYDYYNVNNSEYLKEIYRTDSNGRNVVKAFDYNLSNSNN
jgi:hypothetical protein